MAARGAIAWVVLALVCFVEATIVASTPAESEDAAAATCVMAASLPAGGVAAMVSAADTPAKLLVAPLLAAVLLSADVEVDDACVVSSLPLPPPPPPHALTSALTATARVEPRTVSNKFKAIWVTEVGMSRSQSSSTANPEDTCCDARSIGRAKEVSECK